MAETFTEEELDQATDHVDSVRLAAVEMANDDEESIKRMLDWFGVPYDPMVAILRHLADQVAEIEVPIGTAHSTLLAIGLREGLLLGLALQEIRYGNA